MKTKAPLLPALLLALALPSVAGAATTTIGSDFSGAAPDKLIQCTNEQGEAAPCTITQDTISGAAVSVPAGKVITAWSGYFDAGTAVGLRLMRRNPDGTFTSDGYSGYANADGGVQTFPTTIPVPAGPHTIAIDLLGGSVGALPDPSSRFFASDEPFDEGETAKGGDAQNYEMLVNVTVSDPKPAATPTPAPTAAPPAVPTAGPSGSGPIVFDARAVLNADGRRIDVYARNQGDQRVDGTIALKVGSKTFAPATVHDFDYRSSEDFSLPIKGKPLKRLLRKGKLNAAVVMKLKGEKTGPLRVTKPVKVLRGGARGFDGTYRGAGPLVIVVKRGVITAVSQSLNLFCPRSNTFMLRTMGIVPGFPALVAKDGSFSARNSRYGDTYHYKGTFRPGGVTQGYLSLFHTELSIGYEGKLRSEDCYQASSFKVTRG